MGSSVDRTQSNDRINESQDMPIENSQTEKQREKEKKKKRIELTIQELCYKFKKRNILAFFVEDKVSIAVWIYLRAFYFVPLIYISVFVPVPYCLDDCGFVVAPEVRQVDPSSSILLSQDRFSYSRFFVFPYKL